MMTIDQETPLYRYRISLTGHHVVVVLSPFSAIHEFLIDLREKRRSDDDHIEVFVTVDKRLNVTDCAVRVKDICLIDRPWGNTSISLGEIKRRVTVDKKQVEAPIQKVRIGQTARL